MPNKASLHQPLILTQGQMQLSLSSWPSCPKRELQNKAALTQGPGRDRHGLFPREEEGNGLTGCAARATASSATLQRLRWSQRNVATSMDLLLQCIRSMAQASRELCSSTWFQGKGADVSDNRTIPCSYSRSGAGCTMVRSSWPLCALCCSLHVGTCVSALILEHNCNSKDSWKSGWR